MRNEVKASDTTVNDNFIKAFAGEKQYVSVTDDHTITTEGLIFSTGENTVTLPDCSENAGRSIKFVQIDANTLTIAQNADGAYINGVDSDYTTCDAALDTVTLSSDGSAWYITSVNVA